MKHFKTLILFFVLISIVTSCNKDEETTAQGEYLKANIDGVAFSSTFNQVIFTNSFEPPYKLIDINSNNDNEDYIRITLSSYLEPGTYVLPDEDHPLLSFVYNSPGITNIWMASTNYQNTTGILTITKETSTQIKGTFSFNAINNDDTIKQITNGEFLVNK